VILFLNAPQARRGREFGTVRIRIVFECSLDAGVWSLYSSFWTDYYPYLGMTVSARRVDDNEVTTPFSVTPFSFAFCNNINDSPLQWGGFSQRDPPEQRVRSKSQKGKEAAYYQRCGRLPGRTDINPDYSPHLHPTHYHEWVLEPISKIPPAAADDMRAATSSHFPKKSSVYLKGYASGFSARFPRLASHLLILATKLF